MAAYGIRHGRFGTPGTLAAQSTAVETRWAYPTPQRALSIAFTRPTIINPFGCLAKKGFDPKVWADLDKPDVKVAFDIGSSHDTVAHRYLTKAQLTK